MLSKCWEEAARDREGAAGLACTRLSTGDSAIHRSGELSLAAEAGTQHQKTED